MVDVAIALASPLQCSLQQRANSPPKLKVFISNELRRFNTAAGEKQLSEIIQVRLKSANPPKPIIGCCAFPPMREGDFVTSIPGKKPPANKLASNLDLAVSDRDEVNRNVCSDAQFIRQGGDTSATFGACPACGALQQARAEVEDVTGDSEVLFFLTVVLPFVFCELSLVPVVDWSQRERRVTHPSFVGACMRLEVALSTGSSITCSS